MRIKIKASPPMKKIMLCFLLYGCNSDEMSIPESPKKVTSDDIFVTIEPNKLNELNISKYTSGDQVNLVDLTSSSLKICDVPKFDNQKIYFDKKAGLYCIYEYKVRDTYNNESSSTLTIYSSNSVSPVIDPISDTLLLSIEKRKAFDLTKLITIPDGYQLDIKSVSIIGQEGNKGTVIVQNNVIEYTAPSFAGWNRIIFNLVNPANPESPIMGTIYLTLYDGINTAPSINKPVYDYNIENGPYVVGQEIKLDLLNLKNLEILDKENEDWQLVYANSTNAIVRITDPNSVQNKKLTFKADLLGEHIITYIVADHMNAATVGFIKIKASVRESEKRWTDLIIKNNVSENNFSEEKFSSPPLYSEVVDYNIEDIWDEDVNNTLAGFNEYQAKGFCSSLGKIPLTSQLKALYDLSMSDPKANLIGSLSLWPKLKPYIALDENNNYVGINLADGTIDTSSDIFYVTCVNNGVLSIETINNSIIANGDFQPALKVVHQENAKIDIVAESNTIDPANVTIKTDSVSETEKLINISSTKTGPFKIKVTSDFPAYQLTSETITLIDNIDTAKIASATLSKTTIEANGKDTVTVEVTVTDENNNPVVGKALDFRFLESDKDHLILPTEALVTNAQGILFYPIKVKSSFTGSVINFEVAVSPDSPGTSLTLTIGPSIICEPGFNDSASEKCLKVFTIKSVEDNKNYYYSSPPSLEFYEHIRTLYPTFPAPPSLTGVSNATDHILMTTKDDIFFGDQPVLESIYPTEKGKFMSFSEELVKPWCDILSTINFNDISNWQPLDYSHPSDFKFINLIEEYLLFDENPIETGFLNGTEGWPFYNPGNVMWVLGREHVQSSITDGLPLSMGDPINQYSFSVCSGSGAIE